jgi:sugar phosphate isomerase/epimerase
MKRRTFISSSALLSTSALLGQSIETSVYERSQNVAKVPLKILATDWGFQGSLEQFCTKAKQTGYDGFEAWIPRDEKKREEMLNTAAKHQLEIGFLAGSGNPDFQAHFDDYAKGVELAVATKPLYVNTHAGKDFFSVAENIKILQYGINLSKKSGVSVLCETHRGRCAYNAPVTKEYMDALPDLRLTADLSHWCVVHESLLEGFEAILDQALLRTVHIHARVGHQEGPQVNDPRAPEWGSAVKVHLGWWDKVMNVAEKQKRPFQTFLCEFGPPNYLPTLPYTQQPVADQWGVNAYMMQLLRERYG